MRLILLTIHILAATTMYCQNFGLTYVPGRSGIGFTINVDNIHVGYEQGEYNIPTPFGTEHTTLKKVTSHYTLSKNGDVSMIAGLGYNMFKGDAVERVYPLSFEFGGHASFGNIGALVLFDFVNWEGKFGLTIKI